MNTTPIPPGPSKEHMNMHDLVMQAEFWKTRGEVPLEVGALDNLLNYVNDYKNQLLHEARAFENPDNED